MAFPRLLGEGTKKGYNWCKCAPHANSGIWEQTQIEQSNLSGLSTRFKKTKSMQGANQIWYNV